MLRLIRRPAYPGELNHELVWPAAFFGGAVFAWGWFLSGLQLPQCIFMRVTGLPCLGCGGTRCARNLVDLDLGQAFLFHPGFVLILALTVLWTVYSAVFWLRRDTLRLRIFVEPTHSRSVRFIFVALLVVHWAWQCYYLTR